MNKKAIVCRNIKKTRLGILHFTFIFLFSGVQVFYQHSDNESFKVDAHGKQVETLDILSRAKFCLVAREKYGKLSTPLLMATLHAGCIPIIVIDNLVLPFSEVLDWKRFSIRFYEHDSELIYDHVMSKVNNSCF